MTTKSSSQQPQPTGISNNEDIIHNGWLEKKGRVMKNWKRRWFILRSTILEYYDGQSGVKKGDIEITIDTKVLMRDGTTHLFKFGIQTGDRILELSTDCDDERLRWMDAIHRVVNNLTNNMNRLTLDNSGIKDRFSNLLSKKTNMEEDTPMNRVLRGHATMNDGGATTTKPTRRVNRRTRNKKTSQPLSSDKNTPAGDCQSDESDHDRDTTTIRESSSSIPEATNLPQPPPSTQPISPPLPEGWAQVVTEDGRIYYYHKITRVSRSVSAEA